MTIEQLNYLLREELYAIKKTIKTILIESKKNILIPIMG